MVRKKEIKETQEFSRNFTAVEFSSLLTTEHPTREPRICQTDIVNLANNCNPTKEFVGNHSPISSS